MRFLKFGLMLLAVAAISFSCASQRRQIGGSQDPARGSHDPVNLIR